MFVFIVKNGRPGHWVGQSEAVNSHPGVVCIRQKLREVRQVRIDCYVTDS